MSTVSVIIPAYNAERYIEEAIQSVLRQTFRKIEIIVVDDGSADGTGTIVKKYGERIRYFYQGNKGLAAARNSGIRISSGSYLAFLDSDDLFLPEKIEVQTAFLDAHQEIGMVFSDFEYLGGAMLRHAVPESFKRGEGDQFLDLLRFNCIAIPTVLIRREIFDETGFFDESFLAVEDYDLWLRVAMARKLGYIDRILAKVRLHPENMSKDADLMCAYEMKVVDKVTWNHPEIGETHRSLLRRKRSVIYFESGYRHLAASEMRKAREKLLSAVKSDPAWYKPYVYLISSLLGAKTTRILRRVRRTFSRTHMSKIY